MTRTESEAALSRYRGKPFGWSFIASSTQPTMHLRMRDFAIEVDCFRGEVCRFREPESVSAIRDKMTRLLVEPVQDLSLHELGRERSALSRNGTGKP
ncbi:MAG: hypothetical protein EOQ98_06800 [Mesorhizobium sp.]|uniref:hypothetical protein n=1 Tax=Mesorhizobium sp. TaxID=1871066 RepID=UPI000FE48A4B|nr:hypothetical protein [Mesorhizobium sp.]RWP01390.1 MAG: hypothetical protein EOQ98_06800 [Mesorhizobium sp.]